MDLLETGKEAIIGKEFKCLDKGFIRVVDLMGNDAAIVQAARVSYGQGTKTLSGDKKLIRYLVRNFHTSPLEMCEIKIHAKMPLYVFGQWVRHRMASLNCVSYRYSEVPNEFHIVSNAEWRKQSESNKQGSSDEEFDSEIAESLTELQRYTIDTSMQDYQKRLSCGVAREQARKDLPQSAYTEFYWKIDLHNLLHFLKLRTDNHAQLEIRQYAEILLNIVKEWCPITYQAFMDYRKNSIVLSAIEAEYIRLVSIGKQVEAVVFLEEEGLIEYNDKNEIKENRELKELQSKLQSLGINLWKINKDKS